MKSFFVFTNLALMLCLCSCRKDNEPVIWKFTTPEHFPEPLYQFENNPQTFDKFKLGRDLFSDPILSLDSTISCASCHSQTHYFADHNQPFSFGVGDSVGKRNSPSITNLAWQPYFMWDGGVNHIEVFSVAPITNQLEMKETMANVVSKLNNHTGYKEKFKSAFGADVITDQHLLFALTQFMIMIISDNSKYDQYIRGEVELSTDELSGLNLFRAHCSSCHTEPLFTDFSFRNNGLDEVFQDQGRGIITQNPNDMGTFKVPSLRNVANTYPYMHDGRFFTLDLVLDHYTSGIKTSETLDPSLNSGIPLTETEKQQIISFLNTLTDYSLIDDKLLQGHH